VRVEEHDLRVCLGRTRRPPITFPGNSIFEAIWLPTCTPGTGYVNKTVQYQFLRVAVAGTFCVIFPHIQLHTDLWSEK
jgi:hypothetical protein